MEIKIATLDAIPQIEVLYQELFLEMSILQPKYIRPTKQDVNFIRFTIIEEDSDILIAEKDQEIVGFLLLKEMTTPRYTCMVEYKYAFIIDVIVGKRYQSKGIGTALLLEAKKRADTRKLDYLELNVLSGNKGAIALYEKLGFQDMNHTMRFEL